MCGLDRSHFCKVCWSWIKSNLVSYLLPPNCRQGRRERGPFCNLVGGLAEEGKVSKVLEEEPPSEIGDVLEEFKDFIPPKLPKALPPRWVVDHAIELVPGAKPPT